MPELPEIETVARALRPKISGKKVTQVIAHRPNLRWAIADLSHTVGQTVLGTDRRSKYLKIQFTHGDVLIHLGMSGYLYWADEEPKGTHDHWEMHFDDGSVLRLRDHRRFGAVLWVDQGLGHKVLDHLGPEPLETSFDGRVLQQQVGNKKAAIKGVIMNAEVVVGVGNIYATEALFHAKIDPRTPANFLKKKHFDLLAEKIKHALNEGIRLGGATLRDYHHVDGGDGLFAHSVRVYGRSGQPCFVCQKPIQSQVIAGRNSFWCGHCQKLLKEK